MMFAQGYGLAAHNALPSVDTPSMKGATREDVAKVLADMVRGEELGSGFSMTNGGFTQGTTRGVSEIISGILTAGTGSVRINLGGGRKRYVTFESGVGTDRSYLRMGVATVKQVLGEFAGEVLAQRDLTAAPQLYWEWGAHVDTLNLLSADVSLSRQLNDTPRVAEAERDMHRIHHDPAYREGRFIINSHVQSTSDTKGLNGLLGMTHNVENRVSEQSLRFS